MNLLDTTVACWVVLSGAWLVGAWLVLRTATSLRHIRMTLLIASIIGIGCAVTFSDVLSDDGIRYRWDGWVTSHGVNPYAHAPNDPALHWLAHDDVVHDLQYPADVAYPHIRTIYPPASQVVAAAIAVVAGTDVLMWKLCWCLLVVIIVSIALRSLWHDVYRSTLLLLAVSSPVFILHGVMDMHFDVLMALCTLIAVLLWQRDRFMAAGIMIGIAIMIKYLAIVAVPFMLLTLTWRERRNMTAGAVIAIAACAVPFASPHLFDALGSFAAKWQTNSLLYTVLSPVIVEPTIRRVLSIIGIVAMALVWWRWRHRASTATSLSIMAFLLVSPVVHAWYILMPLLLLPLAPLRSVIVWGATMVVYGFAVQTYKGDGVWREDTVALAIEFIPVMAAWAIDVWKGPLSASRRGE